MKGDEVHVSALWLENRPAFPRDYVASIHPSEHQVAGRLQFPRIALTGKGAPKHRE